MKRSPLNCDWLLEDVSEYAQSKPPPGARVRRYGRRARGWGRETRQCKASRDRYHYFRSPGLFHRLPYFPAVKKPGGVFPAR